MYPRILVPIDASTTAAGGLNVAITLAKELKSRIRLIHIVDELPAMEPLGGSGGGELVMAQLHEIGEWILTAAAVTVRAAGIPVDSQLVEQVGVPTATLVLREAETWHADLIVCGTHARTGVRRAALGSTAEEIVRRSSVPVLLVPFRSASA